MESKFPSPPPDLRAKKSNSTLQKKESTSKKKIGSTMSEIMRKQAEDVRQRLMEFKIVSMRLNPKINYDILPTNVNILLFGPAGSGKSSLIRTFYRALYNTDKVSESLNKALIIKDTNQNEGTTLFTGVTVKEEEKRFAEKHNGRIEYRTSGIRIQDTRGQIWMDRKEQEQLHLIIQGKVKELSYVEQRNYRYAYLLWEFWKRDSELFPSSILTRHTGHLRGRPHCIVFVFDGSMDEIPNGPEETQFYKEIMQMARERKYFYPQIVLTCIDKVEDKLLKEEEKLDEIEREQRLREIIDMKIERVVLNLGVSRSNVYFVENYKGEFEENDVYIDCRALRLLHECVQQADAFLQSNLKEKSRCVIQ